MKRSLAAMAVFGSLALIQPSAAQDGKEDLPTPWGPQDQIGAANRMTPERVLEAVKLVTEGKMYSLGIVIDRETPAFPPGFLSVTILQPNQTGTSGLGDNAFTYNDEIFMGWLGIGSHMDGLGHAGINHLYYGGRRVEDFADAEGLTELGLHNLSGIVARGVLLDMAGYYGVDIVEEGRAYTAEDVKGAAKRQGVELREGDVVLFHSNWMELLDGENPDRERFAAGEPGLGVSAANYLADIGVIAVGADTWAVEAVPAESAGETYPVHQILLTRNGIYLLENMDTRELAADEAWEFLFVLGHPRLRGTSQMIINPIAIR